MEKKIKGRKRHIVTDTMGNILKVVVHAANTHDTVGGCYIIELVKLIFRTIIGVCGDAGYRGTFFEFAKSIGADAYTADAASAAEVAKSYFA